MKRTAIAILAMLIVSGACAAADGRRFEPAYETVLGRLGSRFFVNLQPQRASWKRSPMGSFMAMDESLYLGAETGGVIAAMPFQKVLPKLNNAESSITMTSAAYRGEHPSGLLVEMTVTSPFYPRDEELSSAPFVYLEARCVNRSAAKLEGRLFIGETFERDSKIAASSLPGPDGAPLRGFISAGSFSELPSNKMDLYAYPERYKKIPGSLGMHLLAPAAGAKWNIEHFLPGLAKGQSENPGKRSAGVEIPFSLEPGQSSSATLILSGWVGADMLYGKNDSRYIFKYTKRFEGIEGVVAYAAASRAGIAGKTRIFDAVFEDASLGGSFKNFLGYAFQSWMINTWWALGPGGEEWFSEMEGDCLWHSTVDVSYNTALIYYELWPELLKIQLEEWPRYLRDGKIIMHDMGRLLDISGTDYSMPVEENANYILMLHHYLSVTRDEEFVRGKMPLARSLVDFIIECDKDGDGFPEEGNYNTYERKIPNPLGAKGVVYVAVKAYAAVRAAEQLAQWLGDPELEKRSRKFIDAFSKNLDSRAWLGDHYAVCLQKTFDPGEYRGEWTLPRPGFPTNGRVYADEIEIDPKTGKNARTMPLKYHDAYTILTSNGLFYLLRGATPIDLDMSRISDDLKNATLFTWREAGNPHTGNPDDRGMWLSANIWRDMTAAYLGWDWSVNFDAYWPAALQEKIKNEGVFADSHWYDSNPPRGWDLRYYPRGATAFGVFSALAGMRFDYAAKTIRIDPAAANLRIPLLAFADWQQGAVPVLSVITKDGAREIDTSGIALPAPWKLVVEKQAK